MKPETHNIKELLGLNDAKIALDSMRYSGVEYVDIVPVIKKRSSLQNRALHLYFTMISEQLNELGHTFDYQNPFFQSDIIELKWNMELVKNYIWRPIQLEMFDKKSTTELDTKMINQIIEVLDLYFAQQGFTIEFPSWQSFLIKLDGKMYESIL